MRVLITGAGGFIGQRLTQRLARNPGALSAAIDEIVLLDVRVPEGSASATRATSPGVRWIEGDLTDQPALVAAVKGGVDYVFHLASVPGGAAEANFDSGLRANVDGTRMLLDAMRWLHKPPVFVFASTIGVFGVPMPEIIDEDTYPAPTMSYGAQKWIGEGRIRGHGARPVGIARRALDMMIEYSKVRVTFGRPLADRQAIQFMIADSAMELHAVRNLVYECAWRVDRGEDVRDLSYMVKVMATEMASRVVDRAIQVHGGLGLMKELPLEWWYRQIRSTRITEGANEVLRWRLGQNIIRARK